MNELVMRLCTLLTVFFAVSTTLWLAGMVQAQQSLGTDIAEAQALQPQVASAPADATRTVAVVAQPVEQAASAVLAYARSLR